MADVHLRPITIANAAECVALELDPAQEGWVAPNHRSLEEAAANPALVPLGIYDAAARGMQRPPVPMAGFTMYELAPDGVGLILRLMVDRRQQGKGYGKAAMVEVIRRLRLHPHVELIGTCYVRGNDTAARMYRKLGFVEWETDRAGEHPGEVFLKLKIG